jgi:hypothetical protein
LQNDPEEIPRLVRCSTRKKVDMITGWRKGAAGHAVPPLAEPTGQQDPQLDHAGDGAGFGEQSKDLPRTAIKGIKLFRGAHRYFPTLVKMRGGQCTKTPVKHSHRFAGTAKYGFRNRAFVGIADLFGVRWMKKRHLATAAKSESARERPTGRTTQSYHHEDRRTRHRGVQLVAAPEEHA